MSFDTTVCYTPKISNMLKEILNISNQYAEGAKKVQRRRDEWLAKYPELKNHLKDIADYLNANTTYQQGFFVDSLHAFNEDIKGTSSKMPSVSFRSGEMPMLVTFKNSMGEKKGYVEEGFHITFNPTITGEIVVLLLPHQSDLNEEPPPYTTLAIIDDPIELTMDLAEQIIKTGMEIAQKSSFTGMSVRTDDEEDIPQVRQTNPIGFKRYETTEKIK